MYSEYCRAYEILMSELTTERPEHECYTVLLQLDILHINKSVLKISKLYIICDKEITS
jgi:hypothetical protein